VDVANKKTGSLPAARRRAPQTGAVLVGFLQPVIIALMCASGVWPAVDRYTWAMKRSAS